MGLATSLFAQIGAELGSGAGSARIGHVANSGSRPYTAEFKTVRVQTLANGTTITRESTEVRAMDSQHRTMVATTMPGFSGPKTTYSTYHVDDPIDGTEISWDSRRKKTQLSKPPSGDQARGCWRSDNGNITMNFSGGLQPVGGSKAASNTSTAPAPSSDRPKPALEDLGTANIQGLEAHGHRTIMITPIGAQGNDQPLLHTDEIWTSSEFGFMVRNIMDDPRSGKRTMEMTSFTPGEPDPALFQPPADYEVVTIEFHQVACEQ